MATNYWIYAVVVLIVTNLFTLVRSRCKKDCLEGKLSIRDNDVKRHITSEERTEKVEKSAIMIFDRCWYAETVDEAAAAAEIGVLVLSLADPRYVSSVFVKDKAQKIALCLCRAGEGKLLGFLIGTTEKIFRELCYGTYMNNSDDRTIEQAFECEKLKSA